MDARKNNITGIILAGGQAKRMNDKDKGLLIVNGERIIDHIHGVLSAVASEIMIISNTGQDYGLDVRVHSDKYLGKGPVGGIHSGLSHSQTEYNFVLGCDMPFISLGLVNYILQFRDYANVIIPRHDKKIEPLCGVYKTSVAEAMEESILSERLKMHDILSDLNTDFIEIDSHLPFYNTKLFTNVNTPEELSKVNRHEH